MSSKGEVRAAHLVLVFTSCEENASRKFSETAMRETGGRGQCGSMSCMRHGPWHSPPCPSLPTAAWEAGGSYHLLMATQRRGMQAAGSGSQRWDGDDVCTQVATGPTAAYSGSQSQDEGPGFSWTHAAERKGLPDAAVCPPCLPVSSDRLSPRSGAQRVNLNPRKCQEPHLLLHLKWEYFALFFFSILIWSSSVCVAAFSPDAHNAGSVFSGREDISDIKMNKRGKWETGSHRQSPAGTSSPGVTQVKAAAREPRVRDGGVGVAPEDVPAVRRGARGKPQPARGAAAGHWGPGTWVPARLGGRREGTAQGTCPRRASRACAKLQSQS